MTVSVSKALPFGSHYLRLLEFSFHLRQERSALLTSVPGPYVTVQPARALEFIATDNKRISPMGPTDLAADSHAPAKSSSFENTAGR